MAEGVEQVVQAAEGCRSLAARVAAEASGESWQGVQERLGKCAVKLDRLQHRFFVKAAGSVKFTQPCLDAVALVDEAAKSGDVASVIEKLDSLEAAVGVLEQKCLPTGGIVIT
jgi:hypothetical protein